jgi:cephalosporin hydroxylase
MNQIELFKKERNEAIEAMGKDEIVQKLSMDWVVAVGRHKYSYNFSWLDRPIIQFPTDIVAMQELIWKVQPDLIIETGIAHGGSIIFSASMMELLGKDGKVLGIDLDIREHNRLEIENHPLVGRVMMIEGSSTDAAVIEKVREIAANYKKVMVVLDSNHTHEHVAEEMSLYQEFVTMDSYMVVFDTTVEFIPDELNSDRPWGKGNNPWTAVQEFLRKNDKFIIDKSIQEKIIITAAIDGYLKRVK